MGFESYLIVINFKYPVPQTEIVELFENCGASFLVDKSEITLQNTIRSYYFEIRSNRGITEMQILLSPNASIINSFFLRFSILSPTTVIDQSFEFLNKLNSKRKIKVIDPELNSKAIQLDLNKIKANKYSNRKLNIVLNNKTGLIIEGGDISTDYIYKNNLVDKIFGQNENVKANWWNKLFKKQVETN